MITLNNRTAILLAEHLAPRIAECLAPRPRPGDLAGDAEDLLTEIEAAAILGLRPTTLTKWRGQRRGPIFRRLGRGRRPAVRYRRADVLVFRDARATDPEK